MGRRGWHPRRSTAPWGRCKCRRSARSLRAEGQSAAGSGQGRGEAACEGHDGHKRAGQSPEAVRMPPPVPPTDVALAGLVDALAVLRRDLVRLRSIDRGVLGGAGDADGRVLRAAAAGEERGARLWDGLPLRCVANCSEAAADSYGAQHRLHNHRRSPLLQRVDARAGAVNLACKWKGRGDGRSLADWSGHN